MKRNLMKEAHKMTKEIVEKYGDVDYRTQLGLCLSFLSQEQEGEQEMKELKGTEKQVKWASDIRSIMSELIEEATKEIEETEIKIAREIILGQENAAWYIKFGKNLTSKYADKYEKVYNLRYLCKYLKANCEFDDVEKQQSLKNLGKAFKVLEDRL